MYLPHDVNTVDCADLCGSGVTKVGDPVLGALDGVEHGGIVLTGGEESLAMDRTR